MNRIAVAFMLILSPFALAEKVIAIRGQEKPVCRAVEKGVSELENRYELQHWKGNAELKVPNWQRATVFVRQDRPFTIEYANFDLNNDKKIDLVVRNTSMLSNRYVQNLYIPTFSALDTSKGPVQLNQEDLKVGLIRRGDTQFRYLGIGGPAVLAPFIFSDATYILVSDEAAATSKNPPKPLVVVKYLDARIAVFDKFTNDAEVICVFY